MTTSLDEIVKQLDGGKDLAALDGLLSLWRERRDGRIGPAIDALSQRLALAQAPIDGKTHKGKLEAWLARESKRDASTVGVLLPLLFAVNAPMTRKRLERVMAWPDDPRVGQALVTEVLAEWVSMVDKPVGTAVFKLLLRHLDDAIFARLKNSRFSEVGPRSAYDGWRTERMERLQTALAKLPSQPLDAGELAKLDALAKKLA